MADREIVFRYSADGIGPLLAQLEQLGVQGGIAVKKIHESSGEASAGLKALNEASSQVSGKIEEMASRLGPAGSILSAMGPAGIAAAAGIGVITAGFGSMVAAAAESEAQMLRIEAVLKATSNASGLTAKAVDDITLSIARSTLATEDNVKQAATQLLTFQNITADVFESTLRAAQDLAAIGFGSIADNAVKLARAMEDPERGLDQLRRSGIILTDQIKEQIVTMREQGDVLGSQRLLIDEITNRVGGAGAAERGTLAGAWHGFTTELEEWMETSPLAIAALKALKVTVEGLSGALEKRNELNTLKGELKELQAMEEDAFAGGNKRNQERILQLQNLIKLEEQAADAADRYRAKQQEKSIQQAEFNKLLEAGNPVLKDILEASERQYDADAKAAAQRKDTIDDLKLQAENAALLAAAYLQGEEAFDAANKTVEVRIALSKLDADATEADRQAIIKHTEALHDSKRALDQEKDAAEEAKRTRDKAAEEARRAAEKFARDQAKAIADFAQDTSEEVIDSFWNMAEGSKSPFDNLKDYAIKIFKEIAAAAIIRPIIQPIIADAIGSITGIGGGAGAGNILGTAGSAASLYQLGTGSSLISGGFGSQVGGWLNSFGANNLGFGMPIGTDVLPGTAFGTTTFSQFLGGAGLGALAGGLLTSLWGGNQTVGSIGGGVTGALLATGNPVLAGVAALATIVGSLFGKPSDKPQGAFFNPETGGLWTHGATGNKFSQENLDAAVSSVKQVMSFAQQLEQVTGGNLALKPGRDGKTWLGDSDWGVAGGQIGIKVGSRDGIDVGIGDQTAHFGKGQEEAAIKWITQQIVTNLTDLPAQMATAIENIDWGGDLETGLQQLGVVRSWLDLQEKLAQTVTPVSQIEAVFKSAHDSVADLADQVKALGISAAEVDKTIADFDAAFRTNYTKDLQSVFNEVSGQGFLNVLASAGTDHTTRVREATTIGVDRTLADNIYTAQIKNALQGLTSDQLTTVEAVFKDVPEIVAAVTTARAALIAANAAAAAAAATAAATTAAAERQRVAQAALADGLGLVADLFDQRLEDLDDEAAALQATSETWRRVSASMAQFNAGLLIDSGLSPLSLEQQDTEAFRQLQDVFNRAKGGDADAAAQFGDLAKAYLTIDKQYNASSEAYARNFAVVQSMATQLGTYAGAQVSVASQQLSVLTQIRDAVMGQRAAVTGATGSGRTYGATDVANLGAGYVAAVQASGMSEAAFLATPAGQGWIGARNSLIGNLTDPGLINQFLQGGAGLAKTPGLEGYGQDEIAVAIAQLTKVGAPIPKYAQGGPVERTGLAYVHAGERVYTAEDQSGMVREMRGVRDEISGMCRALLTGHERQIEELRQIAASAARTADAPYTMAALSASSQRSRMLGPAP